METPINKMTDSQILMHMSKLYIKLAKYHDELDKRDNPKIKDMVRQIKVLLREV